MRKNNACMHDKCMCMMMQGFFSFIFAGRIGDGELDAYWHWCDSSVVVLVRFLVSGEIPV